MRDIPEEKYIVAAVFGEKENHEWLDELEELVRTQGGAVVGRVTQNREHTHPATYFGRGKLAELKEKIEETGATGVVCDDELSAAQYGNMTDFLGVKVVDRTVVILDIFAKNANSAESIVQTELAQLNYRKSRLSGLGKSLSRQGGGIGTRGPGETKLESDRRHIQTRIEHLNTELVGIAANRRVLREGRERNKMPVISLVGYTNAGKSTILNMLTNAGVAARDELFATLTTTSRAVELPLGAAAILTDTVGFIRKLPHQIIKAFSATIEELGYADILLHVIDISSKDAAEQAETVYKTLRTLGIDKPVIEVYNKIDVAANANFADSGAAARVRISAKTGQGKDALLNAVETELRKLKTEIDIVIPYTNGQFLHLIHEKGDIISEEFLSEGTRIHAFVPPELAKNSLPE
ncbi:GTPase HflX [Clostridia bacterium]|nr:GTPase HflX [Clostridia bacterium]